MLNIRRTLFAFVAVLALAGVGVAPAAAAVRRAASGATEIGVTAKTINIAVVADVDNPIAPNVFKGVVDGAQAGAKYVNANGGVAGRKLVVDFIDSKLNPNAGAQRHHHRVRAGLRHGRYGNRAVQRVSKI